MHIFVFVIILVAGLLYWIFLSASTIKKIYRIQHTKTTKIYSLPNEGQVEVGGMTGQKILETPINKSPCVWWQLEVQEFIRKEHWSHKGGYSVDESWKTVYIKTSSEPFEIYDDTGYIFIQPENADLILGNQTYIWDLDIQMMNILDSFMITTNSEGEKRNLAVYERFIAPEQQIYTIGEIHRYDGVKFTRNQITAQVISDQDESGILGSLYQRLRINAIKAIGVILICFLVYIFAWIAKKYNIRK
jgi:hypothetical protein